MKIISFYSSRPQCGKSTAADRLLITHDFVVKKFAQPLKDMVAGLLAQVLPGSPSIFRYVDGDLKETPVPQLSGLTPRRLMQTLGTEWGRALDKEFWVRVLEARLESRNYPRCVVDDMRFPNEYDMLKRRGAVMVRIDRPTDHEEGTNHASEGALNDHHFDHVIVNSGSLEDFLAKVDKLADIVTSEPRLHY